MAYIPNLTWTVADVDRVIGLARRNLSAGQIAEVVDRDESDVKRLCFENGIFVRYISAVPK